MDQSIGPGRTAPAALPQGQASSRLDQLYRKARASLGRGERDPLRYDLQTFEMLRQLRGWRSEDMIVDVGANDGRTIRRWRRHLPLTQIIAFEPVTETFRTLEQQTAALPNIRLCRTALGAEPGRREMYLDPLSTQNSFYPDRARSSKTETVVVDNLDRFADQEGLGQIALLKIDTSGHDLEVLKGAKGLLEDNRVDLIQVEAGFGAPGLPMPTLWEVQAYLTRYGYHLHSVNNQCRARLSRYKAVAKRAPDPKILIYCDALFLSERSYHLRP